MMMQNPFTLAMDMQRQAWEGAAEAVDKSRVAPDRTETLNSVEVAQTPSEVVYEENKMELLHYEPQTEEQHDVPILIVYALINRPTILDLQPDRSVVHTLLEEGFDVYLIDWNEPSALDRSLTLDDYVSRYMDNCVDVVRERSGLDSINILGYCMGGTMSVMYASLFPEKVRNLGLMAAGLCFDGEGGVLELWGGEDFYDPELVTDTFDNVPAGFLDVGFALMDPVANNVTKYVRLFDNVEDEDFVENFARMERWLDEGIDVAGATYDQFIGDIYQDNLLHRNELYLDGKHVDLENIDMPVLNIVAEYDHLIPPGASKPFNEAVPSEDTTTMEFATGHIGMSVSSRSHAELWPDVCDWFEARSNGEAVEAEADRPEPEEPDPALAEDVEGDDTGPEELTEGESAVEIETGDADAEPEIDEPDLTDEADAEGGLEAETDTLGDDPSETEIVERSEDDVQEEPAEPGEMTVDDAVADDLVEEDLGDEPELMDLTGIGQAYADDLREAGVESVDALAAADAAELAETTGISERRIEDWIDQATDR